MTSPAASGLHVPQPVSLALHVRRDAVALWSRTGELALVRRPEQGIPVAGRVVVRRRGGIGRYYRGQVQGVAGRGFDLGRIHQPVAAHPHAVVRFWKVGQHVAPTIISDDDLDELGGQIGRFRDHPDPRFRSRRAGDDPAEIVAVDADRFGARLSATHQSERGAQKRGQSDRP